MSLVVGCDYIGSIHDDVDYLRSFSYVYSDFKAGQSQGALVIRNYTILGKESS